MPLAQAARELLLMKVHDRERPIRRIGARRIVQRQGNLSYPNLRKQQRAQAVELRHGQRLFETRTHHAPQSRSEFLGVRALGHLVLEQAEMLGEHLLEIGLIELLAGNVSEHGPEAERNDGPAREAMSRRKQQLPVALQRTHDLECIFASLLQRIAFPHHTTTCQQLDLRLVGRHDRLQAPILHLEHEQAVRGMNDDEVRMPVAGPDRQVVPNDGVLLKEVLQSFRQP
ncbi:hypothetical protein ABH992_002479 [Bradyrhizobium yuanmingense]|uniref:Uncharacterized protein n=1 Tax=Bradyrhizobium yuanmingense TaxID=108015 RepID=A0ABV4GDT1_9BRAD